METLKIQMKTVGQEFDPNYFLENRDTRDTIQQRYVTGLIKDMNFGLVIYVNSQRNEFEPNWLSDGIGSIFPSLKATEKKTY
mmetsp:Transcript_31083/g.41192  ORF Transcript_31083/g.41192 Transcript_31083/m.41192 type:complete len:82 (-) Transcript_31083:983-1228(-)